MRSMEELFNEILHLPFSNQQVEYLSDIFLEAAESGMSDEELDSFLDTIRSYLEIRCGEFFNEALRKAGLDY